MRLNLAASAMFPSCFVDIFKGRPVYVCRCKELEKAYGAEVLTLLGDEAISLFEEGSFAQAS